MVHSTRQGGGCCPHVLRKAAETQRRRCPAPRGPQVAAQGPWAARLQCSPLQFADGVFLLLLIGQLEGFFLHLKEFYLTPTSPAEMVSFPEVSLMVYS